MSAGRGQARQDRCRLSLPRAARGADPWAEAIAQAATRPTMRFVAVKTTDQPAVLMRHKVRDLLVRQRTMLINALRGHLAAFGIVAARGPGGVTAAIAARHESQMFCRKFLARLGRREIGLVAGLFVAAALGFLATVLYLLRRPARLPETQKPAGETGGFQGRRGSVLRLRTGRGSG